MEIRDLEAAMPELGPPNYGTDTPQPVTTGFLAGFSLVFWLLLGWLLVWILASGLASFSLGFSSLPFFQG